MRIKLIDLKVDDILDCWRVEEIASPIKLLLFAEMKLPGRAWLEFEVKPFSEEYSLIYQTAVFDPKGILGRIYWYLLFPIHYFIFKGMLRQIARKAELRSK